MGASAYVISKEGINKFIKFANYEDNVFRLDKYIEITDIFIYKYLLTYIYKYNFISTSDEDSEIHSDHLQYHKYSSCIALNDIINNKDKL